MSVHILTTGPYEEFARKDLGEKWCFQCRKRRAFTMAHFAPVIEPCPIGELPTAAYYGNHSEIRCDHCNGVDTDLFPGYEREWSE